MIPPEKEAHSYDQSARMTPSMLRIRYIRTESCVGVKLRKSGIRYVEKQYPNHT